jgi:hypothetical protein
MIRGSTIYRSILSSAFFYLYFSRIFEDRTGEYDWGVYIKNADDEDAEWIANLCNYLIVNEILFIDDNLDECFALSFHTIPLNDGGYERTFIGQLVRDAKPYDRGWHSGNRSKAEELASWMIEFIQMHSPYRKAELLVAVPPSNPNKLFDLPSYLVEVISESTQQKNATSFIRKIRTTRPMKECRTIQEKEENIKNAFEVEAAIFRGKTVILVDDIYQTGLSIKEVGRVLKQAGAKLVLGLVATKTTQNL